MEFMLGCNYWASHAGTDMWRNCDESVVRGDLERLSQYGVKYLRVFPNWRDFQPVKPLFTSKNHFKEYVKINDEFFDNPYYLDNTMTERFKRFCEIADDFGCRLIVGLLTGWMSGRMFIPPALYGKNLFTDFQALLLEQKFCKGMVLSLKDCPAIYAWDLGNECNCMSELNDRNAAASWTMSISNTIRAYDPSRPIVSGMHAMRLDKDPWTIADQGEHTDILTTHPYPHWVQHGRVDRIASLRTLLAPTAESVYYSSIGHKPCLVEEIGTMGPMICDNKTAADFLKVNMFSNWANGQLGVLWWCAHEQSKFNFAPYRWNMCERELGMEDINKEPKPVLKEMKKFADLLNSFSFELPARKTDAVCLLSDSIDHWGTALISYILAKQSGVDITFCDLKDDVAESDYYLLPSVKDQVMDKQKYDILKKRVFEGAKIYISNDFGFLSEFSEFTGLRVSDSENTNERNSMVLHGKTLDFERERRFIIEPERALVIAEDDSGIPVYTVCKYGKGYVYYLNFPLEKMLIEKNNGFETDYYLIYKRFFEERLSEKTVRADNPFIGLTEHPSKAGEYVILVNYSDKEQNCNLTFKDGYGAVNVIYGSADKLAPFEAGVLFVNQK